MWEQKLNGAQGRNRTLAYPTESPSFFEWRLSSVPTSGPGALRGRKGATLCRHIKIVRVTVYERSSALCRIPSSSLEATQTDSAIVTKRLHKGCSVMSL